MKKGIWIGSIATLLALLLVLPSCKPDRPEIDEPPPPPNVEPSEPAAQPQGESGFSVDLGDRPEFTPNVEAYDVDDGLANVGNLRLFEKELRPEHIAAIAKNGFVVVPAQWKQMEFIYEQNNYAHGARSEHLPSFVTTDSALHFFHIFYDYVLRTIEVSTLYERVETMAIGILRGCAERYEQERIAEVKEAALHNFGYALVPVKLLELPSDQWGVSVPEQVTKLADAELALIEKHGSAGDFDGLGDLQHPGGDEFIRGGDV